MHRERFGGIVPDDSRRVFFSAFILPGQLLPSYARPTAGTAVFRILRGDACQQRLAAQMPAMRNLAPPCWPLTKYAVAECSVFLCFERSESLLQLALAGRALLSIQIHVKLSTLVLLAPVVLAGCTTHDRSPDEIREQTARATSTAARDAKAVVQGVVQGVRQQRTININRSSSDDLRSLPGIDDAAAHRIIENRPYSDSYDLVKRHIVSHQEYDRISGKIEAR